MTVIQIEFREEEKSYDIVLGKNLKSEIKKLVQTLEHQGRRVAFLVDEKVFEEPIGDCIKKIQGGECNKNLDTAKDCYDFLIENKIDRRGVLFVIGGGVVGDIGGFVAATYLRGIDYYQVPTTLLSMVDSGIGGKNAVNLPTGKNLIGTIYQPKGVFIDIDSLKTLPDREFSAGMAEIIKYGLIRDSAFFEELEKNEAIQKNSLQIMEWIERSCFIKKTIVEADEKDQKGIRSLLNFGHTFGHAIESVTKYEEYLHGEAISIGMMMAARLSELLGYLTNGDVGRIKRVLEKYELPIKLRSSLNILELNQAMQNDKKRENNILKFIVLKKIGEGHTPVELDEKWVAKLWKEVGAKG